MSPIAQCMTVSSTVRKLWLQNVAIDVLDPVEKLVIRVFENFVTIVYGFRSFDIPNVAILHRNSWSPSQHGI